ncbi:MAG: TIGR03936 family radical SAM-associated protein [Oscillospiraceae bacterium]|nr:TIGR03936 family radical SAM-associated protein [Oscillospiraceae bacterium]
MAKLRLIFVKEGRAVYISHLDLLRTFQRVFIREGLVLRHSQGFHPHPVISFALPLSVGQASECEILDFEVTENVDCAALPDRLNRFMPEGIRAVSCAGPVRPVRDLSALRCQVELVYDNGVPEGAAGAVAALFAGESVVIQKRTKRKEMADVDIRPMLLSLKISEMQTSLCLEAEVSAQNPGLNPALLAAAVERYLPQYTPDFVRVRRLETLTADGRAFR